MAIVISGVNNNDKITAADGNIDLLSAVNYASPITVTDLTASNKISGKFIDVNTTIQLGVSGVATATTFVGNLTGNVNQTSNLLLQIAGSEKFRIASSGQLGIGGANYGNAGQVLTSGGSGSAATWSTINSDAINEGNTKAEVIDSGSDGRFIVETEGSERLRINSSGQMGLGTNNPNANFHIKSTFPAIRLEDDSDYSQIDANGGSLRLLADAGNASSNSNIQFSVDGTERLRITSTGAIGIGTNNPISGAAGARLAVHLDDNTSYAGGTARGNGIIVYNRNAGGHSSLELAQRNSANTYGTVILNAVDPEDGNDYGADFTIQTRATGSGNYGERLRISSTGSVGIAQTNPSKARLHVVGNNTSGDIVAKFKSGGGGADSETYIALVTGYPDNVNDYEGHAHIGVQRNGATNGTSLVFKPHSGSGTSVTERMRITPTGSVTKPQQPYVHIIGITNTGGSGLANNGTATTYGAITYSAGRVTAQVEGNYLITYNTISDNGTGRVDGDILVNGSNIVNLLTSNNGTGYRQKNGAIVYHLNANDYVEWSNADWYSPSSLTTAWRTASVYLLG